MKLLKLILTTVLAITGTGMIAHASGLPVIPTTLVMLGAAAFIPNTQGMLFTISAADVVSEWGAYYINQGQNMDSLISEIYTPSETAAIFPLQEIDDTIGRKVEANLDRVLQPFQKAFTPIGTAEFTPKEIPMYRL